MKKRSIVFSLVSLLLIGGLSWTAWIYFIATPLAFNATLKESSKIYDKEGILLDEIHGEEHRTIVNSEDINPNIKAAVIAIEDANFYKHKGVSVKGVLRAISKATQESIKTGKISISEGASTIPMQLAKNLNGSVQDRTFTNKIIETIQAIKLNNLYSKDEILTKYLNVIYWGNNTYGIETATQTYFGKNANDVELHEAALLAAIIQNPSRFNPYHSNKEVADDNYSLLKNRQKAVLNNLAYDYSGCTINNELTNKERTVLYNTCLEKWTLEQYAKPILLTGAKTWKNATGVSGYIVDLAINEIISKNMYGVSSKKELQDKGLGLNIYSTISLKDQKMVGNTVRNHSYYKGGAQISTTAIDPTTGAIIYSIGGLDYDKSPLNRSMKEGGLKGRQAGSSMKPYVYYTAYADFGWEPSNFINDSSYCPIKATRLNKEYCPKNYGGEFSGLDSAKNHLAKSRNIPAVKLGQYVGIKNVIRNMRNLGITSKLDSVVSFPLGSNNLYLIENVAGYGAFANGGNRVEPYSISKIDNNQGDSLYTAEPNLEKVLTDVGVSRINETLRHATTNGTGFNANTVKNVHTIT